MTDSKKKKADLTTVQLRESLVREMKTTAASQDRFIYEVADDAWKLYKAGPLLAEVAQMIQSDSRRRADIEDTVRAWKAGSKVEKLDAKHHQAKTAPKGKVRAV